MKRCSFKVAKAIKEAGYPQEKLTDKVYLVNCDKEGKLAHYNSALYYDCVVAPYAMDAWLWLWREKKIMFHLYYNVCHCCWSCIFNDYIQTGNDPEEAIIAAIEFLVDKDLIK